MIIKAMIYVYRYALCWAFPPSCRFIPSCSQYSLEALEIHGTLRGVFLMIFRLLRCHPFSKEGIVDPVPVPFSGAPMDLRKGC